jgi:hypothetical protein
MVGMRIVCIAIGTFVGAILVPMVPGETDSNLIVWTTLAGAIGASLGLAFVWMVEKLGR